MKKPIRYIVRRDKLGRAFLDLYYSDGSGYSLSISTFPGWEEYAHAEGRRLELRND